MRKGTLPLRLSLVAAITLGCGAPPSYLAPGQLGPAPAGRRVEPNEVASILVSTIHTQLSPGTVIGGQFDDDTPLRVRLRDVALPRWDGRHSCPVVRQIVSELRGLGYPATQDSDCSSSTADRDSARVVRLAGTLEDLTLNTFDDPGWVDSEVGISWEVAGLAEQEVMYHRWAYGHVRLSGRGTEAINRAVDAAILESLRRMLADVEFVTTVRLPRSE